jgi:hypothetical protein
LDDSQGIGVVSRNDGVTFKEEVRMYLTDIIWWGYTAFVVVLALFMLFFAYKVTEKGD